MKIKPWKNFQFAVLALFVAFGSMRNAQSAESAQGGPLQILQADLDHVADLSDAVSAKLVSQDASVCEPGNLQDQLFAAMGKMTADYALVLKKIPASAVQLYAHIEEDSRNAESMVAYLNEASLKTNCVLAARGDSAKVMAKVSIALQVTHNDASDQSVKTMQLSHEAGSALSGLAKR